MRQWDIDAAPKDAFAAQACCDEVQFKDWTCVDGHMPYKREGALKISNLKAAQAEGKADAGLIAAQDFQRKAQF